ncbi:hypothetical protein CYMTET_52098 [Cymbomonas tetramitiformis]|uniref:Uncharacterized protein n=1 Tax=Cymbomonas tetramitiformis TaxID=36881 RepID=A0AAE0BJN9_9CHLO|nr:hypothetical protein CYMTET_52098 [Cymbomonas tetramitiformis]
MVLKLVKGVTKFPRSAADTKSADKDGLLAHLEHYSNLVRKTFQEAIVIEALTTPSCTPTVSEYQASVSSLLWNFKEYTLQDQPKSDLAICSLTQGYLENTHGEAIALKQAPSETAAEYFSRLETRMASVNFLAGRNCVEMTNLSMLSTYRRGLKYAPKVMRRLRTINLDVSKPQEWERKATSDDIPGTHNALLKIREIAEEVENDMETETAQRRAADRPPRANSLFRKSISPPLLLQAQPLLKPPSARHQGRYLTPIGRPRARRTESPK